jgi:tetratricopeptide (TPR) repeat protein
MKFYLTILIFLLTPVILFSQNQDTFLYGRAEMEKGNYNDAIRIFDSGLSSYKASADLLLNLGQCYYNIGDYTSAIHYLLLANTKKKNISSLWLAKSYALIGKNDSAIISLNAHLLSPYKFSESTIKLDPDFQDLENTKSWKELWMKEWYDEFENLLAEISYLTRKNEYIETLDLIDQNITKYSNRHQIYAARGKVFLDLKNFNSAVTAYTRAIEINGTQADYYINRAQAYSNLKKYDLAVSDLIKALSLEPDNFPLYLERSRFYNHLSRYDLATNDVSYYLSFFPEDIEAMYVYGQIYYNEGSYIKALEWFNKCLSIDQSKSDFFNARGNAYLKTHTYKFALQDFGMALDLDPKNPETYFNKGLTRFYMNDTRGACSDWQRAARLGSTEAIEMLNSNCQSQK